MQPYWANEKNVTDFVKCYGYQGRMSLFWHHASLMYGVEHTRIWMPVYSGGLTPPEEREAIENFAKARYGL